MQNSLLAVYLNINENHALNQHFRITFLKMLAIEQFSSTQIKTSDVSD